MSAVTTEKNSLTRIIAPLFLVLACPPFAMLMWHTNVNLDGSFTRLFQELRAHGTIGEIIDVWSPYFFGTAAGWKIIGVFAAFQLLLMKILPGKSYSGTITPMGNIPEYRNNALASYIISFAANYFLRQ
jgi:7-dehydrocholesterol reductase